MRETPRPKNVRSRSFATRLAPILIVGLLMAMSLTATLPAGAGVPLGREATHVRHPETSFSQYETLYLDAAGLREKALAQQAISLTLFGTEYTFSITPIIDMPPGSTITTVNENGLPLQLPVTIILFRGTTADPDTSAMLSLPGEWVAGEILTPSDRITLEPKENRGGTGLVETIVARASDRLPAVNYGSDDAGSHATSVPHSSPASAVKAPRDDVVSAETPGTPEVSPDGPADSSGSSYSGSASGSKTTNTRGTSSSYGGSGGSGGSCSRYPRVQVVVDGQYRNVYGSSTWPNQVRTIFGMVNSVYHSTFCVSFQLYGMALDTGLNHWDIDAAFIQFQQNWGPKPADRDFMVFFSGKNFDWCSMGQGHEPGSWTIMQQDDDPCHFGFGNANWQQAYIAKHELGHNHNANHANADVWNDSNGQMRRSIMKSEIEGIIEDYFSYGGKCWCQNNAARIRGHVQQYGV